MSTPLFEHIGEEMTEEEEAISTSTPGFRFDVSSGCSVEPAATVLPDTDEDTEAWVEKLINDEPVVMFALEWCEFCWSVRKLFDRMGIDYRSVDLDSVEYQEHDLGGRIRAVLHKRTGSPTIPQIMIDGTHIGGASELFNAVRDGSARDLLDSAGVFL